MNTTYFLGAGASANAIPLVDNSTVRFNYFIFYLMEIILKEKQGEVESELYDSIATRIKEYSDLVNNASKHLSYDTYAKKLWLQGDDIILRKLKEFISIYYTFEHFQIENYWQITDWYVSSFEDDKKRKKVQKYLLNNFTETRDKRYDSFIAGIYNERNANRIALPTNISIISWNYDLQMELAFDEYNIPKGYLGFMFDPISYSNTTIQFKDRSEFIKLNGSCLYDLIGNEIGDNITLKDLEIKLETSKLDNPTNYLFDRIKEYVNENDVCKYKPFINFAWERNIISNAILTRAKEVMRRTDCLIIIGYSFPLFNREIDKELFEKLSIADNSKIYIQTISDVEFNRIKTRIQGLKEMKDEKFIYIPDVNQFYVPFELNDKKYVYNPMMSIQRSPDNLSPI